MGFHLLGVCESELTLVYWTGAFFGNAANLLI